MSGSYIVIGAVLTAGLCAAGYLFSPRGQNQVVYRTTIIMTLICLYLMWAITYLAQLHPLIAPRRSDLKAHSVPHSKDGL
ncbi:ATP synthase subunit H-domain-containing protein [Thamnocephalis sphaerospora]|uniref:ATP synthase subunit H-domain-containing protein n=1 Tax=Thamnocephalis sphaerospora TaxID=78915 RepID=A0A4P9XKF4_9FUNG|nr:ATP synthase subunit H-domain-containing protein [Thamnocephalis sphaerospora]|eukprot:RKP06236.1 ATP synthase subunit H-domain-containing protein [Thamnocephalis sphaerospora]